MKNMAGIVDNYFEEKVYTALNDLIGSQLCFLK